MKTTYRITAVVVATAALAGCALITGLGDSEVGIIEWIDDSVAASVTPSPALAYAVPDNSKYAPVLEAPDTVQARERFKVLVRTYGSDGCWEEAGAETTRTSLELEVVPYDRHNSGRHYCTAAPIRLPRTFEASFPQPGEAVIRIKGRRIIVVDSVTEDTRTTTTLEKRIIVE